MTQHFDSTFIHKGRKFGLTVERDDDLGEPWKEHDGHGIVSDWTTRDKYAGERVLAHDRHNYRYYDFAETIKIAKQDGWGPRDPVAGETKKQAIARAVEQDFAHLKAWCNDEWYWCGIIVTLLNSGGIATDETESLWGIESEDTAYIDSEAKGLADTIVDRVDDEFVEEIEQARPDMYNARIVL